MIANNSTQNPLNQFGQDIYGIHSYLINNFNDKFKQVSPQNFNFNNVESIKTFWLINGTGPRSDYTKLENDYLLLSLVMRTKQVANETLYDFIVSMKIDPYKDGGWFKNTSFFGSHQAHLRAQIFKDYRGCDVETFYEREKEKKAKLVNDLGLTKIEDIQAIDILQNQKHISNDDLKNIIETSPPNCKTVMFNTLVAIGNELGKGMITDAYFKRTKVNGVRLTNAFAISDINIYVIPKNPIVGKGTSKKVSDAFNLINYKNPMVRLKSIPTALHDSIREAEILKQLHQEAPNGKAPYLAPPYESIIRFTHPKTAMPAVIMFQEKLEGGDGHKLLNATASQQLQALIEVATGLAYMHQKNYVHSDNKLDNILFHKGYANVADFGASTFINGIYEGSNYKYAPNEIVDSPYSTSLLLMNPAMDSFEFGGIILTIFDPSLIKDQTKLGKLSDIQIIEKINKAKTMLVGTDEEKRIRSAILDVAEKLMKYDPNARLSCADAVTEFMKIA